MRFLMRMVSTLNQCMQVIYRSLKVAIRLGCVEILNNICLSILRFLYLGQVYFIAKIQC